MPENPTLLALEQLGQPLRIDARDGNVRADPVDDQRAEQEHQPALEVAELASLAQSCGFVGQVGS
jgi:hypothetical protein